MAKVTVCKKSDFTVLDNGIFRDKRLSLKARGLLVTMLSLPEEWNYTVEGLSVILKEGQSCIKGVLKELEDGGYLVRKQTREENGYLGKMEYIVYEKPINKGFEPSVENPLADNPTAENSIQLNKKELSKDIIKHYSSTELKACDFDNGIIAKIKSLTSETVLIDCLVSYLRKYKEVKGVSHPDISMACLSDFLETADYLFDGYYDDLKADDGFEKMIDRHFACRYKQKIDYKFQHFASSKILEYQARYFGYIDGYKE